MDGEDSAKQADERGWSREDRRTLRVAPGSSSAAHPSCRRARDPRTLRADSATQAGGQPEQQQASEQGVGARGGVWRVVTVWATVVSEVAAGLLAAQAGVAARAGTALVLHAGAAVLAEQLVVVAHVGCGPEGTVEATGRGTGLPGWDSRCLGRTPHHEKYP